MISLIMILFIIFINDLFKMYHYHILENNIINSNYIIITFINDYLSMIIYQ